MEFCINSEELRRALVEIEQAEKNGFKHCLAIFRLISAGISLKNCRAEYNTLWERAHPINGAYDWGRGQGVTRDCKFKNGKLIKIKKNKK